MKSIGAYEAKTRLSAILEDVRRGERYAITKHGVTVALLVPAGARPSPSKAVDALRELRQGKKLGPLNIRTLIREGRRR